jgi:predicted DCC family thiol-disulfide oxidoreductase YuxK
MSLRARIAQSLFHTYVSIDPRTLGLFRICLGAMLLLDLSFRIPVVEHFYSNDGLLPNHTLLWAPPTPRQLSFFYTLSTPEAAGVGMALCGLVFVGLILGFRTKLFQILSFICLVSLNTRTSVLENGGDMVMNILTTFTMFMPLGKRFSIDSLLTSLRAREEHTPAELYDRAAMRVPIARFASLVVFTLILQLTLIYFFNVVHKTGRTWLEDLSAVHLTLHQDRIITTLGVWLRENLSIEILKALTMTTIVVETVGAVLVFSPFFPAWTRGLAIALMPGLHLGFALCINLGPFSYAMALFFALLVHEKHWALAYRVLSRSTQRRAVYYDADCGICFLIARVLARMDLLNKLELKPNSAELPAGIAPERAQATLIVQNLDTGKVYERAAAVAQTLRGLPLGFVPALVLQFPGLNLIWNVLYDLVARNRTAVSSFFGLRACGLPGPAYTAAAAIAEPSSAVRWRGRVVVALRELAIVIIVLSCAGELLNANGAVPPPLRVEQPKPLRALMDYVRLYQGWRMFAPEAPPHDIHVSVEATTVDGRVIDPYNMVASRTAEVPLKAIPKRLQNDQYFTTYSLFIPEPRFRPYLTAFEQWILRYHERTGRPKDRIVRFVAYKLTDESPPLGQKEPKNFRRVAFLRFPK